MNFDTAFARLVNLEGGFSDDPRDPGNWTGGRVGVGELKGTKFGIAANTYPDLDIRNLTIPEAKAIYRRDYWARSGGDEIDPAIVYQVWDMAVHSGPLRARMTLQRAVGVADDGNIGPVTISAVKGLSVSDVLLRLIAHRILFLTSLTTWATYGRGWANRMAENLLHAAEDNES